MAFAEEQTILEALQMDELNQYAEEQGFDFRQWLLSALSGEFDLLDLSKSMLDECKQSLMQDVQALSGLLIPMAVLLMLRLVLPEKCISRRTAAYICRIGCFGVLATEFAAMCRVAHGLMQRILECSNLLTPVLITAVALSGAETTASFLSPAMGLCANLLQWLLDQWGIALSCAASGIAIAGNLSANIRLKRLHALFKQLLHWGAGGMMTAFLAVLSIQGRLGAGHDSAAARTARYAIESIIPVIGSNVSDSLDSLLSTAFIVKNAVGATGLALIVAISIAPLARLLGVTLLLRAVSAVSEPLGDDSMTAATAQFADAVEMLLIASLSGAVLCGLLAGSCMSAASNVVR